MARTVRRFVAALCTLLLVLASSAALAAPGAEGGLKQADRQRARVLFRSAEASMAAGRWGEARRMFDELLALKETASVRYNRGICNAELGDWVSAYDDYERALALTLGLENAEQRFINTESQKGLREASSRTVLMTFVVRPIPATVGASLLIDGALVGPGREPVRQDDRLIWGPFRLSRDDHAIEARVEGREPLRQQVRPLGAYGEQNSAEAAEVVQLAWPEPAAPPTPWVAPRAQGRPPAGGQGASAPEILGGLSAGFGLASASLWVAQLVDGKNSGGSGSPYLPPAIAGSGVALVTGALALVLGASSAPETPPKASPRGQKGGSERRPTARVMVAPVGAGVGLVGSW